MERRLLLLPLFAVVVTLPQRARSQSEANDRKVTIEITTTENGNTSTKKIDLDNASEEEIESALKELDVMDHFVVNGDDENVVIDIRRFGNDDDEGDRHVRMRMAPVPGVPGIPPAPGTAVKGPYPWLGVNTGEVDPELAKTRELPVESGVLILRVIEDSPASDAGLQEGDVITAVDGEEIDDPKELSETIRSKQAGDKVKITYHRGKKKENVNVELAEREGRSYAYAFGDPGREHGPAEEHMRHFGEPRAFLGVTPGEGEGAVIGSIEEGSVAEEMGLQAGDVIQAVNGEKIADFAALSKKIGSMDPGDPITLSIERSGVPQELSGTLGEREMSFNFAMPDAGSFNFDMHGLSEQERSDLRMEMDKLREEMDKLREDLGADLSSETRITIESRKLTDEEKKLLEQKGVKGLDNELDLGDLRIFPNPSNGFYRIQFDVAEKGDLTVDVHDASGERVYQEKITGFKGRYERTLDLSDRASGNYFLVIGRNGKATSRKLVKQ